MVRRVFGAHNIYLLPASFSVRALTQLIGEPPAEGGVKRWNMVIKKAGIDFELTLPHEGFHRQIGIFSTVSVTPDGALIPNEEWEARRNDWLPTKADGDFIQSLMTPVTEPGKYASWIAAPKVGIDNKPGDFEYVKLHMA